MEIKCVFPVLDSSPLPVESNPRLALTTGVGLLNQRSQYWHWCVSRRAGLKYRLALSSPLPSLSASQLFLDTIPGFSFDQMLFPFIFSPHKKKASVVAREGVFAAGLYKPKKNQKENKRRIE